MRCENKFCIYQIKNICLLGETEIDHNGLCKNCVYLEIDEEYLENMKAENSKKVSATTLIKEKRKSIEYYFD